MPPLSLEVGLNSPLIIFLSLFSEEQTGGATGGVPKLFQEEYDKQKPNGDDEIRLVETRPAAPTALDPSQAQVID